MREIFLAFLRLGLTSFGGPSAHIGYFHAEFVTRRGWLSEAEFAERLALAQFLPGPASSQLGFAIGLQRGGAAGALAAFAGFTLPSALFMALAGLALIALPQAGGAQAGGALAGGWLALALGGALEGLRLVALAVVAQAVLAMAQSLCPDWPRRGLALLALAAAVLVPQAWGQLALIGAAAALGAGLSRGFAPALPPAPAPMRASGARGLALALAAGCLALAALPFARPYLQAGALVFGGGHVVLPLLREGLGSAVSGADFLAGYGLAQAAPGPLFTFATYLGALTGGPAGALFATLAIFAPGLALYAAALPLWARLARLAPARGAVAAVNAAVVGLLAAAWATQIAPHALQGPATLALSALLLALALFTRLPPLALVALGAGAGAVLRLGFGVL